MNEFKRHEVSIHKISLDLESKFGFNYVYADYGSMNLNETTFAPYMVPNFKIKYSTADKYLVVKGLSLKKGWPRISKCYGWLQAFGEPSSILW